MPRLIMMEMPGRTRQVALNPNETKIGRSAANDIVVDAAQVSRMHAVIVVGSAFVTLQDLDSRNGTFVNGSRVQGSQILANGDSIKIGACEMRFLSSDQVYTQVEALRLLTIPGLLVDIDRLRASSPVAEDSR